MVGERVSSDRGSRREKLGEVMERLGLGALLLERSQNFAWYTGGADSRVDHAFPFGVAGILLTRDGEYVLTTNIEAARMREEQTPDDEVVEYPWHEGRAAVLRELSGGVPLGADFPLHGAEDVTEEVSSLRRVLDEDAIRRYRRVGADAEAAISEASASLEPGMDEHEAAAILAAACHKRGLFSPVLLVAGDGRISAYRHPVPVGERFEHRVMLVVCAERGGLYANVTRMVHFENPDRELRRRQEACEAILRQATEATRPGRTLADVFRDLRRFYAGAGFPDEWRLHHQGGMSGYASREVIATPTTEHEIEPGQAFAWNPSVTGAKAEETFILLEDGPEPITARA